MKNPIIHVEVIGGDATALQEFYRDAFSWRFDPPTPHALGDMQYRIAFPRDWQVGAHERAAAALHAFPGWITHLHRAAQDADDRS